MDLLAGFEHLPMIEQKTVFKSVIDVLSNYPKPQHKAVLTQVNKATLGVYLFVSNVRNACKLGSLGLWSNETACNVAQSNLIFALDLLMH